MDQLRPIILVFLLVIIIFRYRRLQALLLASAAAREELERIVNRSPVVVLRCRAAPGWLS